MPCLLSSMEVTPCTKPSSRRISASRSLMLERGHSINCLRARIPLRIRARKSAMGSVIDMEFSSHQLDLMTPGMSPRRASSRKQSRHISNLRRYARARPQRLQRLLMRTLNLIFLGSLSTSLLIDSSSILVESSGHCSGDRHAALLGLRAERHAEVAQQSAALGVGVRRRHDRDVHALDRVDLVVLDLGEDDLLAHAPREVAAPVEPARRHAAKVADARQRDVA